MIKGYFIKVSNLDFARDYNKIYKELIAERKKRVSEYKNQKDKALALCAGYLLSCALKEENLFSENLEIEKNQFGKPYLKSLNNFYFSLSHSGDYAFLCTASAEIGADVQIIKPVSQRLKDYVLTDVEKTFIKEDLDFFKFWTLKESFLKFIGEGVSLGLKNVEVELEKGFSLKFKGEKKELFIKTFNLEGHVFSVIAENKNAKFQLKEIKI